MAFERLDVSRYPVTECTSTQHALTFGSSCIWHASNKDKLASKVTLLGHGRGYVRNLVVYPTKLSLAIWTPHAYQMLGHDGLYAGPEHQGPAVSERSQRPPLWPAHPALNHTKASRLSLIIDSCVTMQNQALSDTAREERITPRPTASMSPTRGTPSQPPMMHGKVELGALQR